MRFSHEDLSFEHPNELFERIPEWDNIGLESEQFTSPDGSLVLNRLTCFAGGSYGMACHAQLIHPSTREGIQCIVKLVNVGNDLNKRVEALKEFMIHAILTHTCSTDPYIAERQELGRMATITKLYAGFRVKGYELDFDGSLNEEAPTQYFVYVMENAGDKSLKDIITKSISARDPRVISSMAAFSVYQISSLLERLGDLVQFNHRDLHGENVLVNYRNRTSSGRQMCGMTDMFTCCVIDFGYSRLTFRGRDILCSYETIRGAGNPEQAYNIGHDITFFLRTLRKAICASVNVHISCVVMIPELLQLFNTVMVASGLDFESDACKDTNRRLITALTFVGKYDELLECQSGKYANKREGAINPYLFHPRTVKMLSAAVLRILAVHCFDPENEVRLSQTRAAFREALERHVDMDVSVEEISS